ncbi:MAG: DUF1326 domain-containing protein [Acidobacteriota bacterium]
MKHSISLAIVVLWATTMPSADDRRLSGDYVEARTAEIFAGGCIMNSEAETAGRQAVMAWRVATGTYHGVTLDGLAVAAAIAADRNLGMREMGGEAPSRVKAVVSVEVAADPRQRDALVELARDLSGGLIAQVERVDAVAVHFTTTAQSIDVRAGDTLQLSVKKEMVHDPACGAMQWFTPFSRLLTQSAMGVAEAHSFSGDGLGSRWSAPYKRSAFWGSFTY